MGWIDTELVLVALSAMVSPTTVLFSVLTLVLGERPLRTGFLFYLGALGATLGIGVLAAFVLGNVAASSTPSSPKTWVAVIDVVAGVLLLGWVVVRLRRPPNEERLAAMIAQVSKVASSPAIAVVGAGAALANPGAFIPLALKTISETDPSAPEYVVEWLFFSLVSLLPLGLALVLLVVAREWALRLLEASRRWLERHVRTVAAVIVILFAIALLRNGIAGLTS
ncbi:MAG TPA: GAP family protein [Gaiellaceae bacterium]